MPGRPRSVQAMKSSFHEIHVGAEYDADEIEFMMAMQKYMKERKRRFPHHHEALAVLRSLGYRKVEPAGPLPLFDPSTGFVKKADRQPQPSTKPVE